MANYNSQDSSQGERPGMGPPITLIAAGVGTGLILSAAVVAYIRSQDTLEEPSESRIATAFSNARALSWPSTAGSATGKFKRKWMLSAAIRMIENDTSRKLLLAALRSMAKRR